MERKGGKWVLLINGEVSSLTTKNTEEEEGILVWVGGGRGRGLCGE